MKMCDECKHFAYVDDLDRGIFSFPSCFHPQGWKGAYVESLGTPLRIDWARQPNAACGERGKNWEPIKDEEGKYDNSH